MIDYKNYENFFLGYDVQAKHSFEHGTLFQGLIILNKCKSIVEIGVSTARTTKLLCQAAQITGGRVYGYDCWDIHGLNNQFPASSTIEKSRDYLLDNGYKNFVLTKIDTTSKKFLEILKKNNPVIDFAFIDGCHSYEGVLNDFNAVYPLLSETGIIAFHDTVRIDGSRQFNIDLKTKFFDGTFDVIDFPYGNDNYRVGISLLVKRIQPILKNGLHIIEQCNLENNYQEIYDAETKWYEKEIERANERFNNN